MAAEAGRGKRGSHQFDKEGTVAFCLPRVSKNGRVELF